jgi:ankyrin repeat protein
VAGPQIFQAVRMGDYDSIIQIAKESVEMVNAPDLDGFTPLMLAVTEGDFQACKVLVESGAEVNALDGKGMSGNQLLIKLIQALKYAMLNGNSDMVIFLVSKGAHLNVPKHLESDLPGLEKYLSSLTPEGISLDLIKSSLFFSDSDLDASHGSSDSQPSWMPRFFWKKSSSKVSSTASGPSTLRIPKVKFQKKRSKAKMDIETLNLDTSLSSTASSSNFPALNRSFPSPGLPNVNRSLGSPTVLTGWNISQKAPETPKTTKNENLGFIKQISEKIERTDLMMSRSNSESGSFYTVAPLNDKRKSTLLTGKEEYGPLKTIEGFLTRIDLAKYVSVFKRKGINTIKDMVELSSDDLTRYGISDNDDRLLLVLHFNKWKMEQKKKKVVEAQKQVEQMMKGTTTFVQVSRIPQVPKGVAMSIDVSSTTKVEIDKHAMISQMKKKKKEEAGLV